ncbi:MAG TPA: ABC transporter permease, partial [Solirubrobacteraceae bacterium]
MRVAARAALLEARLGLRQRRRRTLLTALGIALAAAMLAAAIVVSDSLGKGFSRAATQAHLADIIVRFDPQPAGRVAQRIQALPDIRYFSLRQEFTNIDISTRAHTAGNTSVEVVGAGGSGPHGYAIVAGHDVSSKPGQVVLERGLAAAWHISLNGTLDVQGLGRQRVVGFAEE